VGCILEEVAEVRGAGFLDLAARGGPHAIEGAEHGGFGVVSEERLNLDGIGLAEHRRELCRERNPFPRPPIPATSAAVLVFV
jgi:hypothetical protein